MQDPLDHLVVFFSLVALLLALMFYCVGFAISFVRHFQNFIEIIDNKRLLIRC